MNPWDERDAGSAFAYGTPPQGRGTPRRRAPPRRLPGHALGSTWARRRSTFDEGALHRGRAAVVRGRAGASGGASHAAVDSLRGEV
jgi:hypothetical protein